MRALAPLLLALAVPALAGCGTKAEAGQAPALALTGRVVDAAGILDDAAEARLTTQLAALETEVGPQMVVVTVPALNGRAIEDYSRELANGWGVGDKDRNDGLLLVIAPNERKVRIELGRGLEGVLSDELCASIIVNDIVPSYKSGDFQGGTSSGVARLDYELRAKLQQKRAA
jgi:uncharacterized membrane protein YgcG